MAPKQRGVHISLRNVTPAIPGNVFERGMLKSNLKDLGCAGLLERPWNLKERGFHTAVRADLGGQAGAQQHV